MSRLAPLTLAALILAAPLALQAAPRDRHVGTRTQRRTLGRIDPLLLQARRALQDAHAPYSGVHTGAALELARPDGRHAGQRRQHAKKIIRGFNSESEGDLQLCAERAAMACVPRRLASVQPVQKIAVLSDKSLPRPCGRCLQTLSEVGTPDTVVIAANLQGESRVNRLRELLPTDFSVASRRELGRYRTLITSGVRRYRAELRSGINGYRPAQAAVVESDSGTIRSGVVIKNTASTFTPATRLPLEELARDSALRGKPELPRTVVIVGPGRDGSLLPLPSGDERQQLIDLNANATVVLYNPERRSGAVLKAHELLPFAYQRSHEADQ